LNANLIMRDASGFIGNIGDVFLQHYSVAADIPALKKRHACEVAFMEKHKERKYLVVTVVLEPAITRLEGDIRALQTEHTRVTAPYTRAGSLALIAPGFKAAIIRGFLGTLLLVTGAGFPFKVTGEPGEAIDFLTPHLTPPMTRADVQRAYDELHRAA
jgi:hypothetical protein